MNSTRYNRNELIEGIGVEGQAKLQESKVLVVGAGGLGAPVLYYLAAAGIGTLGIVDHDIIDISNLQRQILHRTDEIGKLKVISAKEKLEALNPEVNVITYEDYFSKDNALELVCQYDFVVDCSDNYETKYLINDICVAAKKSYSHGAALALRGEVMTYTPGSADYRQVFDNPPEESYRVTSNMIGVLGSIVGIIGSIQATETIKYLTGIGDLIINRILIVDGKAMSFYYLDI